MKVFVAGGTGILGRASIPALIAAGHEVRAAARGTDHAALVSKLGAEKPSVRTALAGWPLVVSEFEERSHSHSMVPGGL